MRGGLGDALDKLARRDELRRRAAGEATGTPPAVTELVEAIAAVVGHHPGLGVTVGVEGAGEPLLLHFHYSDGQVQVNAENAVAARSADPASPAPRHADFDVEVEDAEPAPAAGRDRYHPDPNSDTAERRYGGFATPPDADEPSHLGSRMRDLGMASTRDEPDYPPHPFAATPPPPVPVREAATATDRIPHQRPQDQPAGMPRPLPEPIPLQVERPEETEMAARRLAALLRDDPTLLNRPPD